MKRRRLYYTPGLISIIGLPILLFFYWPKATVAPTCLKVFLPTDQKDDPGMIRFSTGMVYKSLKGKKIVTINLDVERFHEEDDRTQYVFYKKLHFVSQEIERLEFTNDTSTVLKVQLGANNTYGDYVWVLNQLFIYKVKRYAFTDDNFYVYADFTIDRTCKISEPIGFENDVITVISKPETTKWAMFKSKLKRKLADGLLILRNNCLYIIGFCLLILLPVAIKIKTNLSSNAIRKQKRS